MTLRCSYRESLPLLAAQLCAARSPLCGPAVQAGRQSRLSLRPYAAGESCSHMLTCQAALYLYDVPLPGQVVPENVRGRPSQLQTVRCQRGN